MCSTHVSGLDSPAPGPATRSEVRRRLEDGVTTGLLQETELCTTERSDVMGRERSCLCSFISFNHSFQPVLGLLALINSNKQLSSDAELRSVHAAKQELQQFSHLVLFKTDPVTDV